MSATALLTQLSTLSDSLKTTNTLITRLSKLHFSPGSEPLEAPTGGLARLELAQEIHETLKDLEEELEFLSQEAEDYKTDSTQRRRPAGTNKDGEEARITAKVTRLFEDLAHSRQAFRNAQISAKFASEEAKRLEREALYEVYRKEAEQNSTEQQQIVGDGREQLFAGRNNKASARKGLNKDEVLVHASTDVTSALRRTHDLLSTELSRSRFAQETFDESTAALAQLGEDYSNLDTLLSSSKNLLGTLLRSQKSDTWYLETAFYILLTTLCWLFFRRILYGPFVKLPLFFWKVGLFFVNWIVWKPLFAVLSAVGIVSGGSAASTGLPSTAGISSTTRAPLIVQPSATGRAEPFPSGMADRQGIPVGAGGAGAKKGPDAELKGKMSEAIGKMAEASGKDEEQQKELLRRGDGTVLRERGEDEPKNPKKKNFEADVEDAKQERRVKRDEL